MPLRTRDIIVIAAAGGLLLVLALNSLRARPVAMSASAAHRPFAEALTRGEQRSVVEKGCPVCHSPAGRPLPAKHPPKEQCLLCHPPFKGR